MLSEEEFQIEYQTYLNEKEGKLRVTDVEHYTETLFKFQLTKPENFEFNAGQFTMIGLDDTPKRAYSLTSGPQDNFIEFYSIKVPDGALTSKLKNIQVGDFVNVSDRPVGNLVVENLDWGTDLYLLATGTVSHHLFRCYVMITLTNDSKTFMFIGQFVKKKKSNHSIHS